jgi:hypothetical protein
MIVGLLCCPCYSVYSVIKLHCDILPFFGLMWKKDAVFVGGAGKKRRESARLRFYSIESILFFYSKQGNASAFYQSP